MAAYEWIKRKTDRFRKRLIDRLSYERKKSVGGLNKTERRYVSLSHCEWFCIVRD